MSFKMIFASAAALAMAAGTPAFAAQGQNQQVAASESGGGGGGEKAKKICRSFAHSATRMKRERLCLTRADWKKFQETQDEL